MMTTTTTRTTTKTTTMTMTMMMMMMMMEHKMMIKTQSDDFEAKHDDHSVYVIHLHNTLNYFARTFLGTIIYKDTLEVVIPVYHY